MLQLWEPTVCKLAHSLRLTRSLCYACVAASMDVVICADRAGHISIFSLPRLMWLLHLEGPGLSDPLSPSPAWRPIWDPASRKLVLQREADGMVQVEEYTYFCATAVVLSSWVAVGRVTDEHGRAAMLAPLHVPCLCYTYLRCRPI